MEQKLNYFIERTDKNLDNIWLKLSQIDEKLDAKLAKANARISRLEEFKNRVIGLTLLLNGALSAGLQILLKFL